MSKALLLEVCDWEAFYLDQKLVTQGHRVDVETIVNVVIANGVAEFYNVSALNDTPHKDDPLVAFWYVPVEDGETEEQAWRFGWWEFPAAITDDLWESLLT